MKILVTGANGFVGGHLINRLLSDPENEIFAGISPNADYPPSWKKDRIKTIIFDLCDENSIQSMIRDTRPDQVYHLAGISKTFGISTEDYERVNVLGSYYLGRSVLEICGDHTKFLFVSSASIYGSTGTQGVPVKETELIQPITEYGASKASAEMYLSTLTAKGLNCIITRPFNHTGPGQQQGFVCPDLIYRLKTSIQNTKYPDSPVLHADRLDSVRDFTDVRDVAEAYVQIMHHFDAGSIVNVSSGFGVSVRQIIQILIHEVAKLTDIKILPLTGKPNRTSEDVIIGDSSILKSRTGWQPEYTLSTTLKDLWAY